MSLFTKKGNEAAESASAKKIDFKKAYIRLKDGESVRVRLLGITENTVREYKSHGDYKKGIYSTPCIEPAGVECPFCVAANSGVEGWDKFYARKRYLIVFYDIDMGELRTFDASKQQGEALIGLMNDYADSADTLPFTFKRTGSGASDTNYNLLPILKMTDADKEKFAAGVDVEVTDDFLESVLIPKSRETMISLLEKADFPVAQFFPEDVAKMQKQDAPEDSNDGEGTFSPGGGPIEVSDDDLPF